VIGQDTLVLDAYGHANAIITNPPYTRPLMHASRAQSHRPDALSQALHNGMRRLRLEFEQRILLIQEALLALGNGL
jgi:hypothetical protein